MFPSLYFTTRYECTALLTAKTTAKPKTPKSNVPTFPAFSSPGVSYIGLRTTQSRYAGATHRMAFQSAQTYLLGGDCPSGISASCGA